MAQTQRPRHKGRSALGGGLAQPHALWPPAFLKYIRVGKRAAAPETAYALPPSLQDIPPTHWNHNFFAKETMLEGQTALPRLQGLCCGLGFFFFNLFLFSLKRQWFPVTGTSGRGLTTCVAVGRGGPTASVGAESGRHLPGCPALVFEGTAHAPGAEPEAVIT